MLLLKFLANVDGCRTWYPNFQSKSFEERPANVEGAETMKTSITCPRRPKRQEKSLTRTLQNQLNVAEMTVG